MKKNILIIFSLFLFGVVTPLQAQQTVTPAQQQKIREILKEAYPDSLPGSSMMLVQNGQVVMTETHGMANMEERIPIRPEHVFAIGSTSKQFTAVGILVLVQQGKVDLKEDITKYIPGYNTHGRHITVENLLTHTSGIRSFTEMPGFSDMITTDKSMEEIRKSFEDSTLLFEPGSMWSYSNSGFFLAAYIIEKVSGQSYADFIRENLFKPAGMDHTCFGSNTDIIMNRAQGYDAAGEHNVERTRPYSWSWPIGAGNIMSTTTDMAAWNNALLSGKIIKTELLKQAHTPFKLTNGQDTHYGYGWQINKVGNFRVIAHGGAIGGYLADAIYLPEKNIYLVSLTNTTAVSSIDQMRKCVLILLDQPTGDPAVVNTKTNLKEYEGVYEVNLLSGRVVANSGNDKIYRNVFVEDGKLYIQRSGRSKAELLSSGSDDFFIKDSPQRFHFNRDKKKKVVSIDVYNYPMAFGPVDVNKKTDLSLPVAGQEIKVPADILRKYLGVYELAPGFTLEFSLDGDRFFTQATGQDKFEVYAKSETSFFLKVVDAKIDFKMDTEGTVTGLTLTQGRKMEAKKIR